MTIASNFIHLLVAFSVAAVLIPAISVPARYVGLIDHPDHRKRHTIATPLTGGLGIFAGFAATMLIAGLSLNEYWTLWLGMTVLMVTGCIDDIRNISARVRLLIQIGVACLMVFGAGLEIQSLGNVFGPAYGPVGLGPFSVPFTIACVVFVINAINMADGLDGLAGGIAVIIFTLLALIGSLGGTNAGLVTISLVLAVATFGFLVHNMRLPGVVRARAFLGDTGSMMLGYAIAWLAVAVNNDLAADVYPISIAWLLVIPGMDTLGLFFRRIRLGRSPFSADRTHLHHILRRCEYRVSSAVEIIHLLVIMAGLIGVLGWQQGWPEWVLFALAAGLMLGYQIFLGNARKMLRWHRRRRRCRASRSESG